MRPGIVTLLCGCVLAGLLMAGTAWGQDADLSELPVSGNVSRIDLMPDAANGDHVGMAAPRGPRYTYGYIP